MNSDQPLLTVLNRHTASCGEPPQETNEPSGRYVGYFQNEHGDQWLFTRDPSRPGRQPCEGAMSGGAGCTRSKALRTCRPA
jgi:hypothetical protein